MPAPTILTSADVGAPTLSGTDGDLYNVLKWALPQLGWAIAFDDPATFKIVFRNDAIDGGSGSYIRVLDRAADHPGTAYVAYVNAYESMSDIDTGVYQTPSAAPSTSGSGASYIAKSRTADATLRKWEIRGDKYRFIYMNWSDTTINNERIMTHIFGDLITIDPLDNCFVMLTMVNSATSTNFNPYTTYSYFSTAAIIGVNFVRGADGLTGPRAGTFYGSSPGQATPTAQIGVAGALNDVVLGVPAFGRFGMQDGLKVRGYFPGIFATYGNWEAAYGPYSVVAGCTLPDGGVRDLQFLKMGGWLSNDIGLTAGILIDDVDGWGTI